MFLTPKSLLGNPLIRLVHIYASLPFILLPAVARSTHNDIKELTSWTKDELAWFKGFLKKEKSHVAGKFNAGQKANFLMTLLLMSGLFFSGLVVWMKSMFSVGFVELNFIVHDFLAGVSILLLIGHIIFTLFNIESLRGIIYGSVDEKWAEEHYPDWCVSTNMKQDGY